MILLLSVIRVHTDHNAVLKHQNIHRKSPLLMASLRHGAVHTEACDQTVTAAHAGNAFFGESQCVLFLPQLRSSDTTDGIEGEKSSVHTVSSTVVSRLWEAFLRRLLADAIAVGWGMGMEPIFECMQRRIASRCGKSLGLFDACNKTSTET
jgi:hypothetical protein